MPDDEDTDEIDEKFTRKFNQLFHKASKERETRFRKDLNKDFGELLGSKLEEVLGTKLDETLGSKLDAYLEENDDGEYTEDYVPSGGHKLSSEHEAIIRQAQKDAQEAKLAADKWKKEADAEKMRNKKQEERGLLSTGLNGRVKPALLNMVVSDLHGTRVVRDEESDAILWKNDDGEVVPFKDGLDAWMKSDAGKEVAPPRQVGGTGGRGPGDGDNSQKNGPMTMEGLGAIITGSIPGAR